MLKIRLADNNISDMEVLADFCCKLAEYDGHKADLNAEKLMNQMFSYETNVRAFLAFRGEEPVGFLLVYECFSVYSGDRGLYISGAYIIEEYRDRGYISKLYKYASKYALDNGFSFMNWIVEENNAKANSIYKKLGAVISDGWSYVKIGKDKLEEAVKLIK